MSRKIRLLMNTEASFLATGYGVYTKELLKRLYESGKYVIAEMASYCETRDARIEAPWIVYGNTPGDSQQEQEAYGSKPFNQFNEWRFNHAVLDFKPDHVFNIRDPWMCEFEFKSPLRKNYYWSWMPTVDSAPQDEAWFDAFLDADALFTYSDWATEVLQKQGGKKLNVLGSAPPSVEMDIFKPAQNKEAHREKMGFEKNLFIVGTVMRNQKRKLFPDLLQGFKLFLDKCKENNNHELYSRSFLYLHTSYPDVGWDIPGLINEFGLAHKTLVTYRCANPKCKFSYPSFFQDGRAGCPKCHSFSCGFPTTQFGVTREFLADVINLFDVGVQYSVCEGFGMPQVEIAACGVPLMAVDYSAMSDVVRKVNGTPIKVERLFRESETNAYRALPDNKHLAEELYKFANQPFSMRQKRGFDAFKGVHKNYQWNKTAERWSSYFQSLPLQELDRYHSGFSFHHPETTIPQGMANDEFLKWAFNKILGQSDKINSYTFLKMHKWLTYGARMEGRGGLVLNDSSLLGSQTKWAEYSQEKCAQELLDMRAEINMWEQIRCGKANYKTPYWVEQAVNRKVGKDGVVYHD